MRLRALDSLRGLAALTVVFSHFSPLTPFKWVQHTPLRLFTNGYEAVFLFFVLSGFVLTVQLTRAQIVWGLRMSYGAYAIRRVCRIGLPYLAAVGAALLWLRIAPPTSIPWAGAWFNAIWAAPITLDAIVHHAVLVLPMDTTLILPPVWSLVYEMRLSFLMPLILLAFKHFGWRNTMQGALLLAFLAEVGTWLFAHTSAYVDSFHGGWFPTLQFGMMFAAGAALCIYGQPVVRRLMVPRFMWPTLAASIMCYLAGKPLYLLFNAHTPFLAELVRELVVTAGCVGIIACALAPGAFSRVLQLRPLLFLGDISYSLYLTHLLVLLAVVHLVRSWPLAPILAAALIIPVAYVCYRFVEVPAIRLGRRLGRFTSPNSVSVMRPEAVRAAS